jgi:5-methylcytosine-specific restriction enzyme A
MAWRDVTREAVLAAVAEYDKLGQDDFLRKYGFDRARSYLLIHDGRAYDSKAIIGAAHGFLRGETPLTSRQFSGGEATVGRLLRSLGFTVRIPAQLTADDLVELVSKLHVRWSSGLPALYQPVALLWAIGRAYRGEPRLESWGPTRLQLGELLVRYGVRGERPRPDYPVAALYNAELWELEVGAIPVPTAHGDAELERWFSRHAPRGGLVSPVYELVRNSASARVAVVRAILETFFQDADYVELLEEVGLSDTGIAAEMGEPEDTAVLRSPLEEAYRRLCSIADRKRMMNEGKRVTLILARPVRSAAARRAVLLRSGGSCENPDCTGQANDRTDTGDPILEIDHIHDLALGGPDDPTQMIALCPNCHAIKTRGRTREELRQKLFVVARRRHDALSTPRDSWQ